jgi:hypothetical protein
MKPGKLFWGVFFLTLGILFLLRNISGGPVITTNVYKIWPLVFVLFGAAYLVTNVNIKYVLFGAAGLVAGLSLYTIDFGPFHWNWSKKHSHAEYVGKAIDEPFNADIKKVFVNLEGGAGAFSIEQLDSGQYRIAPLDSQMEFSADKRIDGSELHLAIKNNTENVNMNLKDDWKSGLNIYLNSAPHYDFKIQTGASSNNYDLSAFQTDKLSYEGGASSTVLKLGQPGEEESRIRIESGASSFKLLLPQGVAAKIVTSTALSSTSVEGFEKISDDHFQTSNYSSAEKKFVIEIEGGVISFDVKQY